MSPARHLPLRAVLVLAPALASFLVVASCGPAAGPPAAARSSVSRSSVSRSSVPPLGDPAVVVTPVAATRRNVASGPGPASVDWRSVTFQSACGLTDVLMVDGRGGRYVDGTAYGIDVIDVAVGDVTGDGEPDAAVLVDCLGGPLPYPHVLVVTADGVTQQPPPAPGDDPTVSVAPVSGGSVGRGERPVSVAIGPVGQLTVRTAAAEHGLVYAPGVLVGGEVSANGPNEVAGTVVDAVDGILTLALTPDDGYRIPYDRSLPVIDARTGEVVALDALVGQDVSVFVDADGRAGSIRHLPRGPG